MQHSNAHVWCRSMLYRCNNTLVYNDITVVRVCKEKVKDLLYLRRNVLQDDHLLL
jgi:hypothetical protein